MEKLTWRSKLSFGLGAFGKDVVYAIISTFLMVYLTDVRLVSPVFMGTLFLVARIFDAFNDPLMGVIVDNTRTRFGKFRPWILIGTILNAVVLYFLYANNSMSSGSYAIYVSVFYILWGVTYTIMDIPYWSMVPALTDNQSEREQISAIPRLFASFAWLIIGTFGLKIVEILGGGDKAQGFQWFAAAVSITFVVTIIIMCFNTKEKRIDTSKEKTSIKQMLGILLKNDQVKIILIISMLFNIAFQLSNAFALYYFKYVTNDENLYSTYAAVAGIAQMGALALFPFISKAIGRKVAYAIAALLPVVGWFTLLAVGFAAPNNVILVGLSSGIVNVGIGFMLVLITVMLADVVDYGEFKLGTRNESIIFSMQTFIVKFAGAFSGFMSGVGLTLIGYVPNVTQTATSIMGMRAIMIVLPAIFSVLCLVVYKKSYKITGDFHKNIINTLRTKSEAEGEKACILE